MQYITVLDTYLPTIEKYLLADDRAAFVAGLPSGSSEAVLFELLASQDHEKFLELCRRIGISSQSSELWTIKTILRLQPDLPEADKASLFKQLKDIFQLHFDYVRPTIYSTAEVTAAQVKGASTLLESDYSLETLMKEKLLDQNLCQELTDYGLAQLKFEDLQKLSFRDLNTYIDGIELATLDDQVYPILLLFLDLGKKQNPTFKIDSGMYKRMSKNQLEDLPKHVKEVVNELEYFSQLYQKRWKRELSELSFLPNSESSLQSLIQKRDMIERIRKWLKEFNTNLVNSFIDQLGAEALQIDLLIGKPDLKLFEEFLTRPINNYEPFNDNYRRQLADNSNNYQSYWYKVHNLESCRNLNQAELLRSYLKLIFRDNPDKKQAEQFYKYFPQSYVDDLYYRVLLAQGQIPDNIEAALPKRTMEELASKKELTILESNKKRFDTKQDVVLKLRVKNVKLITAEVYQMSTEKHYLNTNGKIDDTVSLDFIQPLRKVTKEVEASTVYKESVVDFSLAGIVENKPSVYIVDFKGEGLASRAVIRRGSIIALRKLTLVGVEVRFYQEDSTPIEQLDVWCNNKRIHVKGQHTIPFGTNANTVRLVAVKDGFAESIDVFVPAETYSLNVSSIYHEENFLVGSKGKVVLQARLFNNNNPVSLKALKESRITVSIKNHQNIDSSFDVSSVVWDHRNEYVLEVPVQTYLRHIEIKVTGKVETYSGKPQQLESTHSIQFQSVERDKSFIDIYLLKNNDTYKLKVLGKNGEPKPLMDIQFIVTHPYFIKSIVRQLTTNDQGEIDLGKLDGVTQIHAKTIPRPDIPSAEKVWKLNKIANQVQYPSTLYLRAGEDLSLPIWNGFDFAKDVVLFKREPENLNIISNEKSVLQILDNRLVGKLTSAGFYQLKFPLLKTEIAITVLDAKVWESEGQLLNEKRGEVITFSTNAHQLIGLNAPKVQKTEDSYNIQMELSLPADIPLDSVRAHVISSAFVYNSNQTENIRKTFKKSQQVGTVKFAGKKCSYLSNKELSDEQCYIMNRQSEQKYVGNNLEKPRLLLKRAEKRETNFSQEQLNQGGQYAAQDLLFADDIRMEECRKPGERNPYLREDDNSITTKNNFLKYGSAITPNLHGKVISFKVPLYHQYFKVLLTSQSFAIERDFGLDGIKLPVKDMTHKGLDDLDKAKTQGITMSREVYQLQKGETLKVKGSSIWSAVSSTNVAFYSSIKATKVWDWVLDWPSYSPEKKEQTYDQFCCHELNVYLRYKDTEFFEKIVKPFIANKLEKTVVDYCLLQHPKAKEFAQPVALERLNAFEKCLLVDYLIGSKQFEIAQSIASAMDLAEKGNIISVDEYRKNFDIIVTSKMLEEKRTEPSGGFGFGFGATTSTTRAVYGGANMDFGFYGAPPPPIMPMMPMSMCAVPPPPPGACAPQMAPMMRMRRASPQQQNLPMMMDQDYEDKAEGYIAQRQQYKPAFKPVEKTKEYVETTYFDMKKPEDSKNHIKGGKFWVDLALYLVSDRKGEFLSDKFLYLTKRQEFALAISFLPSSFTAKYSLEAGDENITITAESAFFAFVKEVKPVPYDKKYGVLVSQRYFDPNDPYSGEEDGTKIEKNVTDFLKNKVYSCQTVVINTSIAQLDLQVLQDIPQGSIPVASHEYTKIESVTVGAYSVKAYETQFYFPQSGTFRVYPSNAAKGSLIIAKAEQAQPLVVLDHQKKAKLQTFKDILRSGTEKDILQFIQDKNIFDENTFDGMKILWMLFDPANYQQVLSIFRKRSYFNEAVWQFGVFHQDIATTIEFVKSKLPRNAETELFEYFPLNSNRAHKFMKESKSTILNKEFKNTYRKFLLSLLINESERHTEKNQLALTYYLILQDRIAEAKNMFDRIQKVHFKIMQSERPDFPQLQYDYVACFLDMFTSSPNFEVAKQLSVKYTNYGVLAWRKLFSNINNLLTSHASEDYVEEPTKEYEIRVTNKGDHLLVSLPENAQVEVNFHAVNLELLFSQSPFLEAKTFSAVKPFKTEVVTSQRGTDCRIQRPSEFSDVFVQPVDLATNKQAQQLDSFLWNNPNVKAKVLEDEGLAFVYVNGKTQPGVYCKVYVKENNVTRFFKDGYTDIQGKFKYITSDIDEVETFAILFLAQEGGIVKNARKPNTVASIGL